jgi:hypothetical protein
MYLSGKNFYGLTIALLNACISIITLTFIDDYNLITKFAFISFLLFTIICWFRATNLLFLARTFILGGIGYFPMFVKIALGKEAFFSSYELSTQYFQLVVLMYVTTSFAILSSEIGFAIASRRISDSRRHTLLTNTIHKNFQSNYLSIRIAPWSIAATIGIVLVILSSFIFVQGYGQSVLSAGYRQEQGGEGLPFGTVGVLGAVGIFSLYVAGLKGYFPFWKPVFIALCALFLVYSQLLMGLRQDAISTTFGLIILYNLVHQRGISFKLSYIPIALVLYVFFEWWGVARTLLAEGYSLFSILDITFSVFEKKGASDAISLGTISPIATTFSNTVFLIETSQLNHLWGKSYWEWILRSPPEVLYPNRPIDYAWMFENFGLIAGGGFFELAEVYMNFGIIGALFMPGIISYFIAKSFFYVLIRQTMLSYFILFGFLSVFLRGTWYQTFAFFRAFQVCLLLYFFYLFIVLILRAISSRKFHKVYSRESIV